MTFGAALRKGNGNGVNLVVICGHSLSVQNRPGLLLRLWAYPHILDQLIPISLKKRVELRRQR